MSKLYTAHVTSNGGRDGYIHSSDSQLDLAITDPSEDHAEGTNPEQLFAAAYSACFHGALKSIAKSKQVAAKDSEVTANVTLHQENKEYHLSVQLEVAIPGLDKAKVMELAEAAHQVCPYSKATRNNIEVELKVLEAAAM
jgi:osmotically inducible protein OsmC